MAKFVADAVLDAALNHIKNNATKLHVCSTSPTTYAEASSTYQLASAVIDTGDFTGPADHTSGRKLTVAAQSGMTVTASGTAAHIALTNGTDTLYYVTEIDTDTALVDNDSNTCSTSSWIISIADPT
ncbi:MAG: hypothetical protein HXY24_18800 [Rubrivivax sp.]|nr:hypothetical protein [Rubrivivax sp.]